MTLAALLRDVRRVDEVDRVGEYRLERLSWLLAQRDRGLRGYQKRVMN